MLRLRPSNTPTIRKANRVNKIFSEPPVFYIDIVVVAVAVIFACILLTPKRMRRRKIFCSEPIIIIISLHMPSLALRFHFILIPSDVIHVLFSVCVHRLCFHVRSRRRSVVRVHELQRHTNDRCAVGKNERRKTEK